MNFENVVQQYSSNQRYNGSRHKILSPLFPRCQNEDLGKRVDDGHNDKANGLQQSDIDGEGDEAGDDLTLVRNCLSKLNF